MRKLASFNSSADSAGHHHEASRIEKPSSCAKSAALAGCRARCRQRTDGVSKSRSSFSRDKDRCSSGVTPGCTRLSRFGHRARRR